MIVIIDAIDVDEVVGEAPGNDGQMQTRVLRSDVAKRVGNVARTDHDGAGRGRHLLPTDGDLELPLQNIEDFGLMTVDMERRP